MSDSSFIEILILAVVAGFIGLKLYGSLGRRTGHEETPPRQTQAPEAGDDNIVPLPGRAPTGAIPRPADAETGRPPDDELGRPPDDAGLAAGLTRIKIADPSFERDQFLSGARGAFEMIVTAFAKGELDDLKGLASPSVLASFAGAVGDRKVAGHVRDLTLIAIHDAAIIEAEVERRVARVTLRFRSEQIDVTRDAAGAVVDGNPKEPRRIEDIWTFERDTRARDPNWTLVATRSPN